LPQRSDRKKGGGVVNAFDNAMFKKSMSISFVGLNPTI
jgi:hypothetical protein